MRRRTILKTVSKEGIGLHSGKKSIITLKPSMQGVRFFNTKEDPDRLHPIYLNPFEVVNTSYAVVIGKIFPIQTVEHILSALHAFQITDIDIEIQGGEPPVFDGSAREFVNLLLMADIIPLDSSIEPLSINYPIWFVDKDIYLIGIPSANFEITYTIDFQDKNKILGTQSAHFVISEDFYKKEIADARTFGFFEEIEWMKKNNLALGGSLDNALVYSQNRILNEEIRYDNEAVRHKILDLIGDLYLVGVPIKGHIIAHKAGHRVDAEFAKKLYLAYREEISINKLEQINKEFSHILQKLQISL